ncbi:MAG TPA: hypothetical protein VND22_02265 [Actinomycetota bacterium]|nr:hypothetical protein [Actinomycetota bacterium]
MRSALIVARMKSLRVIAILALLVLLGTACAGPKIPLEVGVKEYPTDVILGAQPEPAPPPPPSANLTPGFPGFLQPPPPTRELPPEPIRVPCPEAHPFTAPKERAPNRATQAPQPASYKFRNNGTFAVTNTANGKVVRGAYPAESDRKVLNPQRSDQGGFSFQVEIPQGDRTTTTHYSVTPESPIPSQAGLFIRQIVTRYPDGSADPFDPVGPGLKLIEFPAEPGKNWDTAGTDPDGTAMLFHARIGIEVADGDDVNTDPDIEAVVRIDACGEFIQAWLIEVTGGRIVGPGKDITFRALYAVATQFGGLIVYDNVCMSGTDNGNQISNCNEATINSVPKPPK